ncbi:hypothetical protein BC829DRAFT_370115, partial [Chytridium lagenaria]
PPQRCSQPRSNSACASRGEATGKRIITSGHIPDLPCVSGSKHQYSTSCPINTPPRPDFCRQAHPEPPKNTFAHSSKQHQWIRSYTQRLSINFRHAHSSKLCIFQLDSRKRQSYQLIRYHLIFESWIIRLYRDFVTLLSRSLLWRDFLVKDQELGVSELEI